jgi:death-on-curing protein
VTVYLSVDQLLALYSVLIHAFGGRSGLRDRGALESAAARPAMTFGGDDLYPDLAAKAAALMHSLVLNHPLVDGNKRLGAAAAELFLRVNGAGLDASDQEFEAIALATASGDLKPEALAIWFRQRIRGPQ